MLKHTHPLHKVTIIPRGPHLAGATMSLPKEDVLNYKKAEMLQTLTHDDGRAHRRGIFNGDNVPRSRRRTLL